MIGKKFNYGWVIVGYGVLCMLLLHYGTVGSQAIFLLPVTQDLGVSTTTLTMASTYGTIVSMIVTPWAGKLMDKKSIRRLMFFGILGTGLTMVAQSYVTSVYTYYAIILVRTALNPFALMMPFAALAARWFTKENRSFATSIIFVGISLGGVLLSNPLAALIETVGWRLTYRYYGMAAVVLLSPLTLALVRDYPDGYEEMIQEETVGRGEQKADLVSLLKDRRFILVCAGMSCISFIGCSLYHISSYVQSLGYDARFGATVISIYNFVCIFSKMIMGRLFDRKGLKAGILFGALGICGSYFLMALSVFQRLVPCGDRVILWNREYMPKYYCAVAGFWCLWGEKLQRGLRKDIYGYDGCRGGQHPGPVRDLRGVWKLSDSLDRVSGIVVCFNGLSYGSLYGT